MAFFSPRKQISGALLGLVLSKRHFGKGNALTRPIRPTSSPSAPGHLDELRNIISLQTAGQKLQEKSAVVIKGGWPTAANSQTFTRVFLMIQINLIVSTRLKHHTSLLGGGGVILCFRYDNKWTEVNSISPTTVWCEIKYWVFNPVAHVCLSICYETWTETPAKDHEFQSTIWRFLSYFPLFCGMHSRNISKICVYIYTCAYIYIHTHMHMYTCEYRYKRVNVNSLPFLIVSKLKHFWTFGERKL